MKVYALQLDIVWEDKAANYKKTLALLRNASPEEGSLLVLPEMFATGFSMNAAEISEEASPGGIDFLKELAVQFKSTIVAGVVHQGPDGKGLNQAHVLSPKGELIATYSKIHPFSLSGELDHYHRGRDLVFFDWNGLKVCPFICYDLRFPEIFRHATQQGAEMFLVIANWPGKRERHWTALLEARAIENLAYVVGVNRAGTDPFHAYPGRSMIIDPHGTALMEAGAAEMVIAADVDPEKVRGWRRDFPALRDMHWQPAK